MKGRLGVFILALFIIFSVLPGYSVKAVDANIDVGTTVPESSVEKGDVFKLTFAIKNISLTDSITDVSVTLNSSSFYPVGSSSTKTYGTITANYTGHITFDLSYDGGNRTSIPYEIKYNLNGEQTYSDSVSVNAIKENPTPSTPDTPTDTSKYVPVLTLMNDSMPAGWAGGNFTIPLNIKNTSSYYAKNITITPELDTDSPFVIDSINLSKNIDEIQSDKSKTVSLSFNVASNAQEKVYPIKLNIKYYNSYGNYFTNIGTGGTPEYIYVKIINSSTVPKLNIDNVELSQPSVQPQQNVDIKLNIGNHGTLNAKDVKVSLIGLKEDGFSLFKDTNLKNIENISGSGISAVSFTVTPSKKMEAGSYGLTAKIEYKDQNGKDYSAEQQFFIPVENDSNGKTVPKIILSQYSSNPTIAKAGQNFNLNLIFLNTSKDKAVQNIKIYFTVPEGGTSGNVFTPVNSSNTFYIDSIPPKGTYEKSIDFFTIPDASPKTYTLTANFEYEDDKGTEYKASDIIGIPVSQQISLDTSDIDIPQEMFVGQPLPVGFDLYNTGKVQLRNMMVRLEGDFAMQNGRYFIGNFDAGSSDHYEGTVTPNAPGTVNGAVILSYDEPTGEHREIRKDFTLNVTEMPVQMPGKGGMPGEMDPNMVKKGKSPKNTAMWVGLGLAGIAAAGFIVFRKIKRKRKEGMTLDE